MGNDEYKGLSAEDAKKLKALYGIDYSDPVQQAEDTMHYESATPNSIFYSLYYLHNTNANYQRHKKKLNLQINDNDAKNLEILIKEQKAREKVLIDTMSKEFDIKIDPEDSTLLQANTIFNKILYPMNDDDFKETSADAFASLLSGAIEEAKIGDGINVKKALEILEKTAETRLSKINERYKKNIQSNNDEDLLSMRYLTTIKNKKEKYKDELTQKSSKDVYRELADSIKPSFMGDMHETGVINALVVRALEVSSKGKIKHTGLEFTQGLKGTAISTKADIQIDFGFDTNGIKLPTMGLNLKNYSDLNAASLHGGLSIDDLGKALGSYKYGEEMSKILLSDEFQYSYVNELAALGKKNTASTNSEVLNYVLGAVKKTLFFQVGNAIGLNEFGQEGFSGGGKYDTGTLQNDFFVIRDSVIPVSLLFEKVNEGLKTSKGRTVQTNSVTFKDIPLIDFPKMLKEKHEASKQSILYENSGLP